MSRPRLRVVAALALLATAAKGAPSRTVHHEIAVRIDPAAGTLEATDRIHLSSGGRATFALARGLAVRRLAADGAPVAFAPDAGQWTVELHRPESGDIEVEYGGRLAETGDERLSIAPNATLLAGDWYPTLELEQLSYDLTVELPAGQTAVAPGRIISEEADARRSRARFTSEGPVDSIPIFAGPYRVAERQHGAIRVRTYLLPELADAPDLADVYLKKVGEYLDLYQKQIGDYPYSSFDVVSGALPLGLGFPGLTYMGVAVLRLPFIPDTSLGH